MSGENRSTLILCDFDGTVSTTDTVNHLIREHVDSPQWRFHVKRYLRGEVGSKGVYEAIAPLMKMKPGQIEDFVSRHAVLDPDFPSFLQWAADRGIDVKIVSDGFDLTIRTLFARHDVDGPEILANRLLPEDNGRVRIESPHSDDGCGRCGTCKRAIVRKFQSTYDQVILIGDGESDRHAAEQADAVLALDPLFVYCARTGIPAVRIDGFRDVPRLLTRSIHAVAFDMDGTLLDSIAAITDAFNHLFTSLGYPTMTMEEVARKTSVSLKDYISGLLGPERLDDGVRIFRDHYDKIYLKKTALIPGVIETLQALDGSVKLGVVTNKRGSYARTLAEHFGLSPHAGTVIGAEDGFKAKPAPDMFIEFMARVGCAPENTIYVGDSPIDIEAAKNAGIDAYAVSGPIFSAEELARCRPRRVLRHITELPEALVPVLHG